MAKNKNDQFGLGRRELLKGAAAVAGFAGTGISVRPDAALAEAPAKTLVIASPATPQSLDIEDDNSLGTIDILGAVYEYLLGYEKIPDPNAPGVMREDTGVHSDRPNGLALQGRLAEKWTVSPDGLKATFVLREGIKSNWGNTLSAEDVKWTWDRKFHLKGQGTFQVSAVGLKSPDQVKIEGPNVVSFNLLKPNPVLLKQQCNLANPIYDSVKLKEVGGANDPWGTEFLKNETSGFGPYRLSQLVRGQQAIFQSRKDYWDAQPFMETVVMREVPTSASRLSLLQGGAVDIAQFLEPREVIALRRSPSVSVDAINSSEILWINLNNKIKPFDDVRVRRAMNLALPREDIIKTVFYGMADKMTSPIPYIYPMFDPKFYDYDFNLDKAKDLLKQAGLADGFTTTISYNAGAPVEEPIALIYQTALRKIGVNLELEKLAAGPYFDNVAKRSKPIIFVLDAPWTPDPGYATSLYFNDKSWSDTSNYSNARVDELIFAGLETLDDVERLKIYTEVQQILMNEAPWGYIVYPKYLLARKANLKGFAYYTSNNLRFQDFVRE